MNLDKAASEKERKKEAADKTAKERGKGGERERKKNMVQEKNGTLQVIISEKEGGNGKLH